MKKGIYSTKNPNLDAEQAFYAAFIELVEKNAYFYSTIDKSSMKKIKDFSTKPKRIGTASRRGGLSVEPPRFTLKKSESIISKTFVLNVLELYVYTFFKLIAVDNIAGTSKPLDPKTVKRKQNIKKDKIKHITVTSPEWLIKHKDFQTFRVTDDIWQRSDIAWLGTGRLIESFSVTDVNEQPRILSGVVGFADRSAIDIAKILEYGGVGKIWVGKQGYRDIPIPSRPVVSLITRSEIFRRGLEELKKIFLTKSVNYFKSTGINIDSEARLNQLLRQLQTKLDFDRAGI